MDKISAGVNCLDSFLGFNFDLFAHCDGEVSELMQEKAAALFNPSFRAAARGSGKPSVDGKPSGLLGGETAVRSRLVEATKEDEILTKTMNKSFKKRSGNRGGGGAKRSRKDRSRSRSRRRSYSRSRRDRSRLPRGGRHDGSSSGKQSGRGRGPKSSRGRKNSGGSNNNNNSKRDNNKDEKKDGSSKDAGKSKDPFFSSPSSFMEA